MSTSEQAKVRASKVGHTKSRGGCVKCRSRRVKCDQGLPECGNCVRLGLDCTYIGTQKSSDRLRIKTQTSQATERRRSPRPSQAPQSDGNNTPTADDVEESKQRRLMELRLLHNWMAHVTRPFLNTPAPRWGELWRVDLPLIAFRNDGVLNAILTMSATHLLRTEATNTHAYHELLAARNQYLVLALQYQRSAVPRLNASNADELSFAALLISLNAFSMLRERPLEPYQPPMDWLDMGRGAGSVMRQAAELAGDAPNAKLQEIIKTTAPIHQNWEPQRMDDEARKAYEPLLSRTAGSEDLTEGGTHEVYLETLTYIATFRRAIESGEPPYVHLRRICMFPFSVPAKFVEFVREQRPRALISLAYFFAVIANTEALRYLGNSGDDVTTSRREIVAIRNAVPQEWQELMIWPMDEVRAEMVPD